MSAPFRICLICVRDDFIIGPELRPGGARAGEMRGCGAANVLHLISPHNKEIDTSVDTGPKLVAIARVRHGQSVARARERLQIRNCKIAFGRVAAEVIDAFHLVAPLLVSRS